MMQFVRLEVYNFLAIWAYVDKCCFAAYMSRIDLKLQHSLVQADEKTNVIK
jgi:hypothetical protein